MTTDTVYQLGSIGKQFSAGVVMLEVEEVKISLDDPFDKYLPEALSDRHRILVRHLLTHTSGIPNYNSGALNARDDYSDDDELLKIAYALPPGVRAGISLAVQQHRIRAPWARCATGIGSFLR